MLADLLVQALPHMQRYDQEIIVIKYGGNAMGDAATAEDFAEDVVLLEQAGLKPVVCHGGGPQSRACWKSSGSKSEFRQGLRVTDQATVDVVEMVLAGSVNKEIVGYITREGGKAIGLCGKDGGMATARKVTRTVVDPDSKIEQSLISALSASRRRSTRPCWMPCSRPSSSPCSRRSAPMPMARPTMSMPTPLPGPSPARLKAKRLLLLTDVPGVLDKNKKLIPELTIEGCRKLIAEGTITGGMIPKIETCIYALERGVEAVVILDGKVPHATLIELFTDHGAGTLIRK